MPGRGRFWGRGDLNDEIVEEADLTQELQTKVNAVGGGGGSGNWEKVGDVTVSGGPVSSVNVNLSRTVALDGTDISMLVAIVDAQFTEGTSIGYRYNNISTGGYSCNGLDLGGLSYTSFTETGNEIFTDKAYISSGVFAKLELEGKSRAGVGFGFVKEAGDGTSNSTIGHFAINTDFTNVTSFQVVVIGGFSNIQNGSHITVYAVTLD